MQPIKLIKNAERNVLKTRSRIKPEMRTKAPEGIWSWVAEFKRTQRSESLINVGSLFKEAVEGDSGQV